MAPIDSLKPGMAAPQDLTDSAGDIVVAKGETLTSAHIARLVMPFDAEGTVADSLDQATRDKIKKRLKLLFSAQDLADPMVRELLRMTYLRLAERLVSGAGLPEAMKKKPHAGDDEADFPPAAASPEALVARLGELAAFPDIYFRINETLQRPNVSAADVAKVVSSDMVLSARLLKVVNSSFYGFRAQVDTVHRAIALAGMNELLTMALGMTAVNYFQDIPVGFISLDSFWRHCVGCGILARSLAGNIPDMNPERMFTAGLLHDIGRLVMAKDIPQLTALAMRTALEKRIPLIQAERKIFEYDHADVGGELLRQWVFPDILVSLVEHHHAPLQSSSFKEACLIRLADLMSNAVNASRGAPYVLAPLTKDVTQELNLPPEALAAALEDHDAQIADVLRVFT